MKTYQTKYSDLSSYSKKEKKIIENQFPFIPPKSDLGNLDLCGQIVSKNELGNNIKFCPICDYPMIVRMMVMPCEHVMCYSCSQPNKGYCYICEGKIESLVRISDTSKLYECDWPDCFKFFTGIEKLNLHKYNVHGQIVEGFNVNMSNTLGMGMNMMPRMNMMFGNNPPGFMPMMSPMPMAMPPMVPQNPTPSNLPPSQFSMI